ncbi:MAG: hypothetical protein HN812_03905 [Candidatus Marinimicrobia bacterium]|jgi:hypothetical protein|nr:hypothetical protein [Candidatus Neomarinimicrobiota bacterium]
MATEVSICSNALRKLGDDPITSLSDNTERARLCNAFYEPIRDSVTRAHSWNFAIRRQALSRLTSTPAFTYAYEYTLPTDPYCLRVLSMQTNDLDFKVEGRKLLTNEGEAKILYIGKITSPAEFDALFTEALTARLAAELAYSITGSNSLTSQMWEMYELKLREARGADGSEGSLDSIVADTFTGFRL